MKKTIAKLGTLAKLERWNEVLALAKQALGSEPENGELWQYVGWAHANLKQYEAALHGYEQACSFRPEDAWTLRNLSLTLQRLDRLKESAEVAERVLALAPEDVFSQIRVSKISRLAGNGARAWTAAHRARELGPNEMQVWWNLAWLASYEENYPEARKYYEEALRLAPNHAELLVCMGQTLKALGLREEGVASFRRAVATDPRRAPYRELAEHLFEAGDEDEAFEMLRRGMTAHPNDASLPSLLRYKLWMYDRHDEAEVVARAMIANFPHSAAAWIALASCHEERGEMQDNEACCRRAVVEEPGSSYALRCHATSLADLGQLDAALMQARAAIDARGGDLENWRWLATMLRRAGRFDEALQTIDERMRENPHVASLWNDRALALAARGDLADACDAMRELLERKAKSSMFENLRYCNGAFRLAWLARDRQYLQKLRDGVLALPQERSRFGKRMIDEAQLQRELFAAMLDERFDEAEQRAEAGLAIASRRDEFGCSMAVAWALLRSRRGDQDTARRVIAGDALGSRGTRRCWDQTCPGVAMLVRAVDQNMPT